MGVYVFDQNNSYGRWKGPAKNIIVEATDVEAAQRGAEAAGAYWNGCASGVDCPCCGDRWSKPWNDKPNYETVEEAVRALSDNRWRRPEWEEEAGGLYVIVRASPMRSEGPVTP
jgi:hypothetical protein